MTYVLCAYTRKLYVCAIDVCVTARCGSSLRFDFWSQCPVSTLTDTVSTYLSWYLYTCYLPAQLSCARAGALTAVPCRGTSTSVDSTQFLTFVSTESETKDLIALI